MNRALLDKFKQGDLYIQLTKVDDVTLAELQHILGRLCWVTGTPINDDFTKICQNEYIIAGGPNDTFKRIYHTTTPNPFIDAVTVRGFINFTLEYDKEKIEKEFTAIDAMAVFAGDYDA